MNIQFMKFRKLALTFSFALLLISIVSLVFKNLELGLDFTGGVLVEIQLKENLEDFEQIRGLLDEKNIDNYVLNFSGSQNDVSIKIPGGADSSNAESLKIVLEENYEFDLRKEEFIGPQIGEELRDQGGLGLLLALLIMAVLAVIGYSLNDTIVVSDRIRENFRKKRSSETIALIDRSLTQMLGRTLITSLTTLLVLFALLIFGGDAIQNFSIALIIGVIAGTYSSIYIVCNTLISMNITADDLAIKKSERFDDGMP